MASTNERDPLQRVRSSTASSTVTVLVGLRVQANARARGADDEDDSGSTTLLMCPGMDSTTSRAAALYRGELRWGYMYRSFIRMQSGTGTSTV